MPSGDQKAINSGMTKYDLILELTERCLHSKKGINEILGEHKILKTYAICHVLVNTMEGIDWSENEQKIDELLKKYGINDPINAP